ncbi:uncharacterized protein LOC123873173 [Maniola jurtina]|uniref:uncharacterized protein LOC123873173 n=1 Tax=Maniola jurtina TaxID=191418 RepID=UPI001E68A8F1|nr:uncharacterized protein LOC123873173 [Maniola jurtina]
MVEEFPKESTKVVNGLSRRQWTRKYFFTNQSETRTELCQTMFLSTLSLSLKKVRVIVEKKRNSEVGILSEDQRRRHQKQKRISEATKMEVDKFKLQLEVEPNLEKKQEIKAERYENEKLYESSYAEKKRDTEKAKVNDKVITLSFDLQKCLSTPY